MKSVCKGCVIKYQGLGKQLQHSPDGPHYGNEKSSCPLLLMRQKWLQKCIPTQVSQPHWNYKSCQLRAINLANRVVEWVVLKQHFLPHLFESILWAYAWEPVKLEWKQHDKHVPGLVTRNHTFVELLRFCPESARPQIYKKLLSLLLTRQKWL